MTRLVFLNAAGACFGLVNKTAEVAMERKAKLFKKGRNQAVLLPAEFAFDSESVWIRRDEEGNVVLAAKPAQQKSWDEFFRMLENTTVPDSFLSPEERNQSITKRDPLGGVQV